MRGEIQQAYYGERGGGHRLLRATNPEDPLIQRLAGTTDHLSTPDRELHWVPYVSGYPLGGWYVLTRTFPGRVTTQAGWALTHALILETEDAGEIADLRSVLSLLASSPDLTDIAPLPLPDAGAQPQFTQPSGRVVEAVKQLIDRAPDGRPIIWIGQEEFEDFIARVWAGLWPAARRSFSFRTAFRPEDADRRDTTLFSTPLLQVSRWAGFPVVRLDASPDHFSPAEAQLAGQPSSLCALINELGLPGADLRMLRHVEATDADLRALPMLDVSQIRMLVRRLSSVAPTSGSSQGPKRAALKKLVEAIQAVDSGFVHTLRNIEPAPFGDAFDSVEEAVSAWTEQHAGDSTAEIAGWLLHTEGEALPWWRRAVCTGVRQRLRDASVPTARLVWDIWRAEPATVAEVMRMLKSPDVPIVLAEETPKRLARSVAKSVLDGAGSSRWPALYSAAAAAAYPLAEALELLLKTFPSEVDAGLTILGRRLPGREITRAVAAREDARLDAWAANLVAKTPALRVELDPNTERGRALWLGSVDAGATVWGGVDHVIHWRNAVLEAVLRGESSSQRLAGYIADTPAADLSGTRWQDSIWSALPSGAKEGFLRFTVAGWIERFRRDPEHLPLPADPLRASLLSDPAWVRARPTHAAEDLSATLTGLIRFQRTEQSMLRRVQENGPVLPHLRSGDAERLGELVARERWRQVALMLYEWRHRAPALNPALRHCSGSLPALAQIRLAVERSGSPSPPATTWYAALHVFLGREFPWGPEQNNVWERAGGELSRLSGRNAAEQWWSAVESLKRGRGGQKLSLRRLLDVLEDELPRNADLNTLRETAPDE